MITLGILRSQKGNWALQKISKSKKWPHLRLSFHIETMLQEPGSQGHLVEDKTILPFGTMGWGAVRWELEPYRVHSYWQRCNQVDRGNGRNTLVSSFLLPSDHLLLYQIGYNSQKPFGKEIWKIYFAGVIL